MTKRPKLRLSHPQASIKKRPHGFRVPPSPSPRPARSALRELPAKPASLHPARAASTENVPQKSPARLNAGTIAKTLLVIGVAALSIYLLKRRLF